MKTRYFYQGFLIQKRIAVCELRRWNIVTKFDLDLLRNVLKFLIRDCENFYTNTI